LNLKFGGKIVDSQSIGVHLHKGSLFHLGLKFSLLFSFIFKEFDPFFKYGYSYFQSALEFLM